MPRLRRDAHRPGGSLELQCEIDLVVDLDSLNARGQREWHHPGIARLMHQQNEVSSMQLVLGTLDAERFDEVGRLAQARSVDQRERHAFDLDRLAQCIARGTGDRRDNRALLAGKPVEQARLADVGPSCEHHVDAAAEEATLAAFRQHFLQLRPHALKARRRVGAV